jgi:DNA modification methylase
VSGNVAAADFSPPAARLKPKDKVLMPHRLAIALCDAGWYVRQDIVWAKPNAMPEPARDPPETRTTTYSS